MVQNVAFVAGVATGTVLLLSVAWVWIKKQTFGMGGAVMCMSGIALVGLTVWRSLQFEITENGFIARFSQQLADLNAKVEQNDSALDTIATTNAELSRDMGALNESITSTTQQFQVLTEQLAASRTLPPERATQLRDSLVVPRLDSRVFEERALRLEQARE